MILNRKKIIKLIYSLLVMLLFTGAFTITAYASSTQKGSDTSVGKGKNVLGPSIHRTGWIFYLIDTKTKKTVGEPKGITCNNEGDNYNSNDSFKEIQAYKNTKLYLTTDFGKSVSLSNIVTGNRANYDNEMTEIGGDKKPAWGYPYGADGYTILGRGDEVRNYFNKEVENELIKGIKIKRTNKYWFIKQKWGIDEASKFRDGEVALFFEPFYWLKEVGQPWRCGTVHSLTKHLTIKSHTMTHKAFPYGVIFETDKGVVGVTMPKSLATPALRDEKTLTTKKYGFGMGAYWNTRKNKTGIINTYNGKDSPGKPEKTSKKKHTKGKSTIIKQYWEERTDQNGEIEYVNIGSETNIDYYRAKTVKNIIITDEENLPTGNPQGYKLVGWFTGKDLDRSTDEKNKANPAPGKELNDRLKKAREKFRGKTNEETITLGEDKNTKKKYKDENSLVVVFLRKKATEGIIDTYNHKDSPGDPEDTSNDKTKQGKKKILKQYWDEFSQF